MYCNQCGTKNESRARYCIGCGTQLAMEQMVPKKSKKMPLIIGASSIVLLVILIVLFVGQNESTNKSAVFSVNSENAQKDQEIAKVIDDCTKSIPSEEQFIFQLAGAFVGEGNAPNDLGKVCNYEFIKKNIGVIQSRHADKLKHYIDQKLRSASQVFSLSTEKGTAHTYSELTSGIIESNPLITMNSLLSLNTDLVNSAQNFDAYRVLENLNQSVNGEHGEKIVNYDLAIRAHDYCTKATKMGTVLTCPIQPK